MEDPIARKTEDLSADRYERLAQSRVSILSNCCWGGLTYHYFKLPFLSPTINLFFTDRDYIRFLENLDGMLEKEPVFDRMAYNPEEDFDYPIFDLCGVKMHMYHCRDKEQGLREWNERRARVNRSNLLVTMITESPETAERFDRLPFEKKVCFVPFRTELPSCVFADPGCIPFVSFVNSFATGTRRLYDPLVLLEEGRIEIPKDGSAQASACTDETEAAFDAAEAVLIYGAKALGTRAFNMLKPLSAGRFAGFAVTSVQGNPSEKYGFPVMSIEDWQKKYGDGEPTPDDVAVIMALFPDYYGEVRRTLQENGFRHIMTFEELEWLYYRRAKLRGGAEDRNNREDR